MFIDRAYNVPNHPRYMPGTTIPNFPLGGVGESINALVAQLARPTDAKRGSARYGTTVNSRLYTPIGAHQTKVDSAGTFASNVDELYRLELGLENARAFTSDSAGTIPLPLDRLRSWHVDQFHGAQRASSFGDASGARNAFVRFPEKHAVVIILSDDSTLPAKAIAQQIEDRLISP